MTRKSRVALLSIFSNSFLIIVKIAAGLFTGSVSVISEAIHSAIDLVASGIAWFSVRVSDLPPDKEHPYGHGKIENISAVIEALLIFAASAMIISEAVERIRHPQPMEAALWGIAVMVLSVVVNIFVSIKLHRVAKEEDSVALAADALHLKADVLTSAGVAIALTLIHFTGWYWFDPIAAILIAVAILIEAGKMLHNAFGPLLDKTLSDDEKNIIRRVISNHSNFIVDAHEVRTRKSGKFRYADLHLTVPWFSTVEESHEKVSRIEDELSKELVYLDIISHLEPCTKKCISCRLVMPDGSCKAAVK